MIGIGFTSGYYTILPQTRRVKGVEIEVPCKLIKIFPTEDKKTGEIRWIRLADPFAQVLLADRRILNSKPIKIKLRPELKGVKVIVDVPVIANEAKPLWRVVPIQRASAMSKTKPQVSEPVVFTAEQGKAYLIITFGESMANAVISLLSAEIEADTAKMAEATAMKKANRKVA